MKPNFFTGAEQKVDRWNKDSEAGKLLRASLENGDIDPHDPPKVIWESYPIFQQYDLAKFRAALNKLKAELGCNLRTSGSRRENVTNNDESGVGGGGGGGYAATGGYAAAGGYVGGGGYAASGNNEEFAGNEGGWMPIHTLFEWCDSMLRERMTVVVLMPTGVNSKYTVAVVGGGTKLEIGVEWPEMLVDAENLHEPFKKAMEMKKKGGGAVDGTIQDYITRMQEFKKHIMGLERRMDRFECKATIELPKTVHAHEIEANPIGRKDGTRILYINLLCECTDSNKQKGGDFFII